MNMIKKWKLYFKNLMYKLFAVIKFQIWGYKAVTKLDSQMLKQYSEEIFHRNLMKRLLTTFDKMPKYDPNGKKERFEKSWFVGYIPYDWEKLLDDKQKKFDAEYAAKMKEKENTNVVD